MAATRNSCPHRQTTETVRRDFVDSEAISSDAATNCGSVGEGVLAKHALLQQADVVHGLSGFGMKKTPQTEQFCPPCSRMI